MRLISAQAKNYRIHREAVVEFDPHRTVIGGPNETGKSTFIEAIHRGLFLKSRVMGEVQAEMVSLTSPGVPQVEVCFEVNGETYKVIKEFNGQRGNTVLSKIGGETWKGDEAEQRLLALLGSGITGRVSKDRLMSQWAHLWVWQGRGGENPTKDAESQNDALIRRLQEMGGAAVHLSDKDARVAKHFSKITAEFFTTKGIKSGSELARAKEEFEKAEKRYQEAKERFDSLQKAREEYVRASDTLKRAERELAEISRELEEVKVKLRELEGLRNEERLKAKELEAVQNEQERLEETEKRIEELSKKIKELSEALEPKREKKVSLEAQVEEARKRREEAESEYENAAKAVRECRAKQDFAAALLSLLEKEKVLSELQTRWNRVEELQKEKRELEERLARLPHVDKAFLNKLRRLEKELANAKAALDAMAAEVEVIEAAETVVVNGEVVAPKGSKRLTEVSEVKVGDGVRLKIRPGGGDSLQKCREEKRDLEDRLERLLGDRALTSLDGAEKVFAERAEIELQIKERESALEELDPTGLSEALEDAKKAVASAQGEMERRREQVKDPESPNTLDEAKELLEKAKRAVEEAEGEEKVKKKALDEAKKREKGLEGELQALLKDLLEDEQSLSNHKANLEMLIEQYGDDGQREANLKAVRLKVADAKGEVERLGERISALNPEELQGDYERLTRAKAEKERIIQESRETMAAKGELLKVSRESDPKVELEEAEAERNFAERNYQKIELRAEAIKLIDHLFREKQKELADRLSQPLAERITRYLRCIFPDAEAKVEFDAESNRLSGVKLGRSRGNFEGAFDFDALSGGTKEQVAAAVRLAIAELLATEHGGTLPVIFDDAFVNTDPDRVRVVQRMLDLAARNGLQVIVLTSNPSDYASFGAKEVGFGGVA